MRCLQMRRDIHLKLIITISSTAFLIKWIRKKTYLSMWLSVLFCAVASTIKFEAWDFCFILFVIIVIETSEDDKKQREKLVTILSVLIVLILFPAIRIYLSLNNTGNAMGFINPVAKRHNSHHMHISVYLRENHLRFLIIVCTLYNIYF